jgi:hypothetical protein
MTKHSSAVYVMSIVMIVGCAAAAMTARKRVVAVMMSIKVF